MLHSQTPSSVKEHIVEQFSYSGEEIVNKKLKLMSKNLSE